MHLSGSENGLPCQNILHSGCCWLSCSLNKLAESTLEVQNYPYYPRIRGRTSADKTHPIYRAGVFSPWNNGSICLRYDIHCLEPDGYIRGHYGNSVPREPHALSKSGEDSIVIIRVTFDDQEEVDLCSLLGAFLMNSLHPTIPVGVLKVRILGFDRPPCCPDYVSRREEWHVAWHRGGELRDRKKLDGAYTSLFSVFEWNNLNFCYLLDLSLVKCLNFYPASSC